MSNDIQNKSTPPKVFKRNEFGLFDGISYVYKEDGTVDYRAMIPKEFIVPDEEKASGVTDIEQLDDSQLIILLGGLKYLAWLRGFKSVEYRPMTAHPSFVALQCRITWIENFETENRSIIYESTADASKDNTGSGIPGLYLTTTAENRAFARAVRNFLRINIVSKEELPFKSGGESTESKPSVPQVSNPASHVNMLKELMEVHGVTLDAIKKKLLEEGQENAKNWQTIDDIPKMTVFDIVARIKEKVNKMSKKQS